MDYIKMFGDMVVEAAEKDMSKARKLLLMGYRMNKIMTLFPLPGTPYSRRYASHIIMSVMIDALAHPERSAIVSLFVPSEPIIAAGLTPCSVEAMSGFLAGSKAAWPFMDRAVSEGICETMCSFHRGFIGALDSGLVPEARFMIYTNMACDGNMISFPHIKQTHHLPDFFIDVPYEKSEDSVHYVESQLKQMCAFIEDQTHRSITEEALKSVVATTKRTVDNYNAYLSYTRTRRLPGKVEAELFGIFTGHVLMGSKGTAKSIEMMHREIKRRPETDSIRLVWLHVMPWLQQSVNDIFAADDAYVTANELVYESMVPVDPEKPYESLARRMVYSCYSGDSQARIDEALKKVRLTNADGVVIFAHWGCKPTIGSVTLIKEAIEAEGYPALILDGDGCDSRNTSDGQLSTRLNAFIEMLKEKRKKC